MNMLTILSYYHVDVPIEYDRAMLMLKTIRNL